MSTRHTIDFGDGVAYIEAIEKIVDTISRFVLCLKIMSKTIPAVSEYLAQIGRKGGLKKGRKGAATMSAEARKTFSRVGVEARRRKAQLRAIQNAVELSTKKA